MITFLKNNIGLESIDNQEPNCWINIEKPTPDDKDYLLNELKIPEAFLNDIEDDDERPRIEIEDDWTLIIVKIPKKNNDDKIPFSTIPLGIIFNDNILVSICFYSTDLLPDFIYYTKRKKINIDNPFDLVLKLMLSSSVWFLKYLKQINHKIKLAEHNLEKSIKNEELQTLFQIQKCLVFFTTSLKGNDILLYKVKNIKGRDSEHNSELLEDVEIELRQALETTNIYSDILSGMTDAYASVISNNLNMVMKQLTSISIILMIPTLIASLYGMNVPNFFQSNPYGFWIVVVISFLFSLVGVMMFKIKNWF